MLEHLEDSHLSKNLYTYCLNNPVNYADPYGDFALALAGGGSLTAGAALGGANFWNPVGWVVLGIQINKDNSLEIQIGDILLSAFCMETEDNNESWRFFERNEDCKHLVCYSDHIEY